MTNRLMIAAYGIMAFIFGFILCSTCNKVRIAKKDTDIITHDTTVSFKSNPINDTTITGKSIDKPVIPIPNQTTRPATKKDEGTVLVNNKKVVITVTDTIYDHITVAKVAADTVYVDLVYTKKDSITTPDYKLHYTIEGYGALKDFKYNLTLYNKDITVPDIVIPKRKLQVLAYTYSNFNNIGIGVAGIHNRTMVGLGMDNKKQYQLLIGYKF